MKRTRRNHSPAFKAKVALQALRAPDGHFKFLHPWPGQIPPPRGDRRG